MKIPAVIVQAEKQTEKVKRLVEYCKKLDGTEVKVFERVYGTDFIYPQCNNMAFDFVIRNGLKGRPFFWLEPDSIPLQPGWLQDLTDEWVKSGKDFMLSSDATPPYDLIGGIGIYGSNAHWLIPKEITFGGWDGWLIRNLSSITHRTPLIQHSYGSYDQPDYPPHHAVPHRFPAEQDLLRAGAKIFHRDSFQDLIINNKGEIPNRRRFLHSGDLGDIIAAMPIIRQLGGGDLILTGKPPIPGKMPRESMKGERLESLIPLLKNESYIGRVEWQDNPKGISHDLTEFRLLSRNATENLAQWQARSIGIDDLDMSPWISVSRSPNGRVVVSRSLRYQNPNFPWGEIYEKYSHRLLFVGLQEESRAFQRMLNRHVEWISTRDLLKVAEVIAASSLFIGNQSAPFWIAAGLGKNLIQETWSPEPNSIVERPNAHYSFSGTEHFLPEIDL